MLAALCVVAQMLRRASQHNASHAYDHSCSCYGVHVIQRYIMFSLCTTVLSSLFIRKCALQLCSASAQALSLEAVQVHASDVDMQDIILAHSAAVYASKSFELDDGRQLMMNWVFETSVGCSGQCSAGTAFTNASVSLYCIFPNQAPIQGPFCPSSWGVSCLKSVYRLLEKWCR